MKLLGSLLIEQDREREEGKEGWRERGEKRRRGRENERTRLFLNNHK